MSQRKKVSRQDAKDSVLHERLRIAEEALAAIIAREVAYAQFLKSPYKKDFLEYHSAAKIAASALAKWIWDHAASFSKMRGPRAKQERVRISDQALISMMERDNAYAQLLTSPGENEFIAYCKAAKIAAAGAADWILRRSSSLAWLNSQQTEVETLEIGDKITFYLDGTMHTGVLTKLDNGHAELVSEKHKIRISFDYIYDVIRQ